MEQDEQEISGAQEVVRLAKAGMSLCQDGKWKQGLQCLDHAVKSGESGSLRVPPRGMAYLGYGKVRFLKQRDEGLELCERALEADFFDAQNYFYLAKAQMFLGQRAAAVTTVRRGLKAVPESKELAKLQSSLGERRKPILGFLPRSHPANRFLGRMLHQLSRSD